MSYFAFSETFIFFKEAFKSTPSGSPEVLMTLSDRKDSDYDF